MSAQADWRTRAFALVLASAFTTLLMISSAAADAHAEGGAVCVFTCAQQSDSSSTHTTTGASSGGSGPVVVQPGAPGQPSKILPAGTHGTLPERSQADVEFMQGMIVHHSQAVEMTALIPTHTDNQALAELGARISSSQADEMKFMKRWLAARGESGTMSSSNMSMPGMNMSGDPTAALMPGMLTPAQMDALRAAHGAEFDRLFLNGMIQHHGGALTMVKDLFNTAGAGQDADIFDFATDADNTQRAEIRIMQGMLEKEKSPKEKQ